jgi:hypothetical protein
MQEIETLRVHPEHKKEIKKAAEFLIDRGWATDPVVVTEDDPDWKEIPKDATLWSFTWGFERWNFYGRKSRIMGKRWLDDEVYYWFVLRLPVEPDEAISDPDEVDYLVIDRALLHQFSADGLIDWLLKDF